MLKKTNKKVISIILVAVLVLSMLSVGIVASAKSGLFAKTSVDPDTYYLVGNINGDQSWDSNIHEDLAFTENSAAPGEYMLLGVSLSAGDSLKVVKGQAANWYPEGMGNDYSITEGGVYNVYFRPDGQGGDDWWDGVYGKFFYVEKTGDDPTETAPSTGSYCLCGYINGADYGMTEDTVPKWNEVGEYVFDENGSLTATFTDETYIQLKSTDFTKWLALPETSFEKSAVFQPSNETCFEKMNIPANVEVTFTLVDNGDGTVTLSYETGEEPTTETQATETQPTETQPTETETSPAPGDFGMVKIEGELHQVKAGDEFEWIKYMNVTNATQGAAIPGTIVNIDGRVYFDTDLFELVVTDKKKVLPIVGQSGCIFNEVENEGIYYNGSNLDLYTFDSDDCVLFDCKFRVKKDFTGTKEISQFIQTMCYLDDKEAQIDVDLSKVDTDDEIKWPQDPTKPTETETKPTETETKPTETETKPTETQPGGDVLIVHIDNKDKDTYEVPVGTDFTYTYYLNVNEATKDSVYEGISSQGYIANIDATTFFDRSLLTLNYDPKTYKNTMFPVLGPAGGITSNVNDPLGIFFNASSIGWDYCFDDDDCVLITCSFHADKAGETDLFTNIKTMCDLTVELNKIVDDGEVVKPFAKVEVIDGVQPIPTQTESKPTETETIPTQTESKPTETESKPTETQTDPTETQTTPTQTESKPTETQTDPTETQTIPTETKKAGLWLWVDPVEDSNGKLTGGEFYEVEQGEEVTYSYYLNIGGYVSSVDATTYYDKNGVQWTPVKDEDGRIDKKVLLPILANSGVTPVTNFDIDGEIIYNYSSIDGAKFNNDECQLITTKFVVTASEGTYIIRTKLNTLGDDQDHIYVQGGVVKDDNFFRVGKLDGKQPGPVPPTTPTETDPTETESKPTETQTTPTQTVPTQTESKPTVKPTESQTGTTATSAPEPTNSKSSTDNNSNNTNGSAVKTGSTELAIIFLMILVLAAGIVIYTKKRKVD